MTSLESYVTWAACTNRRHIFVWSCWCSGSKPITHLLLGGWLWGGAGVLLQKKLWATWEISSACGLSDDLACCRKHEFFSTAVFLCKATEPFWSPWHAYVSEPEVLFAFFPYNPFTFIFSLGPYDATRCLNVNRNYELIYLWDDCSDGTSESRWWCFISINTLSIVLWCYK